MSLLVGRGNGYFDPDGYVTYEEYVTVMLRIAEITGRSNYSMDFEDIAYGISSTMDIDFEGYEYEEFELSASGSKTVYLTVGETEELKVKATPSDVELDESDIEWEASKTGYVRISGEDIENDRYATIQVKALKEGRVTITAMVSNDEDVSVDFTVVISEESEEEPEEETEETVYVSSIKLNPTSVKLELGDSKSITATVAPSNASNKGILWESHNEAVAIVDSNGKITAVGVGNTTVTATAKDGSGIIATIDVTVTATEEVVVPPSDTVSPKVQLTGADTVKERGKVKLIATAMDDNLKSFVITEQQISDLGTGLSISEITKVSDDTYEITLLGVEVSAVPVCINYGAAEDEAGNVSTDSNEVIIFVEANE